MRHRRLTWQFFFSLFSFPLHSRGDFSIGRRFFEYSGAEFLGVDESVVVQSGRRSSVGHAAAPATACKINGKSSYIRGEEKNSVTSGERKGELSYIRGEKWRVQLGGGRGRNEREKKGKRGEEKGITGNGGGRERGLGKRC